jgi:hypothetical protein
MTDEQKHERDMKVGKHMFWAFFALGVAAFIAIIIWNIYAHD